LADIGSIPMFIKYPKGQGPTGVDDRFVRSVDVFPTIAMVLGLPLPGLDGRDLRDPAYRGHSDVLVESTFGGPVRMSTTRWQRARDVSLRRRLRLFGSGKHSLYVWGVNARLVGQAVPAVLPAPAPAGVPAPPGAPATTGGTTPDATTTGGTTPTAFASVPHATIVHASAFAHVDPTATVCACQIGGRITGADPKGMQLAVAINGTVVATVEGFTSRGGLNWSAVVPPTAFRDGDNRVQVYRVENGELAQELS
ncbi:MAG: hypothetical protein QOJ29_194, partial [Thermoleophilaceae bacterium]|nr:hypothetical protein [Thermoleophilaceae bacterium]